MVAGSNRSSHQWPCGLQNTLFSCFITLFFSSSSYIFFLQRHQRWRRKDCNPLLLHMYKHVQHYRGFSRSHSQTDSFNMFSDLCTPFHQHELLLLLPVRVVLAGEPSRIGLHFHGLDSLHRASCYIYFLPKTNTQSTMVVVILLLMFIALRTY